MKNITAHFVFAILSFASFLSATPDTIRTTLTLADNSNNGQGKGGLCVSGGGMTWDATFAGCRNFPYSEIVTPWNDWHHYVLVWNEEGLANNPELRTALYVDGEMKVSSPFVNGAAPRKTLNTTFVLGFNLKQGTWSNAPFSIDEFRIWNSEKLEFCAQ